jgi:hypothetical protein
MLLYYSSSESKLKEDGMRKNCKTAMMRIQVEKK